MNLPSLTEAVARAICCPKGTCRFHLTADQCMSMKYGGPEAAQVAIQTIIAGLIERARTDAEYDDSAYCWLRAIAADLGLELGES